MRFLLSLTVLIICSLTGNMSFGQILPPSPKQDTTREFEIIRGPSMRMIKTDTGSLQTIAGGAVINQGATKFYADSLVINNDTRNMEAFGNVHINDGDTVQIYSRYLRYAGNERVAFLKNDVKLKGRNGTLFTKELDYNLRSGIGNYYQGGKVINDKNVITSNEGTYYADTKDVYFKKNVKMDGPKNHIVSDSLVYNMDNAGMTFISSTYIKNDEVEINTSQGTYDTKTGNAFFTSRSTVKDSSGRLYTANTMALDGKSGNAQLEGNAVIIDSANGFVILANQVFINRGSNSFLATRKPVLIIKQKHDSTYIAADIIFSGLAKMIHKELVYPTDSATQLSAQQSQKILNFQTDSAENFLHKKDTVSLSVDSLLLTHPAMNDTLKVPVADSGKTRSLIPPSESPPDSVITNKSISNPQKIIDTIPGTEKDTLAIPVDTLQQDSVQRSPDSTRYFIAYHNVRIFNDSLQSVCDSLFISSKDSVFRLYYDPVLWSGKTQVTGDTMLLFTKNKEADRLFVFDRAMVVNQTKEGFFNQMSGKTLNAYFKNSKFDYIRLRGSQAESVYYMQDDDSAYFGMNRSSSDVIDMLFNNGELQKVKLMPEVKGIMYPMDQIPDEQRTLKRFEWLDKRRPKSRAELFQ